MDPVVINEELPKKYESYSSSNNQKLSTLDEPVIDTVVLQPAPRKETSKKSSIKSKTLSVDRETMKKSRSSGTYGDH